MPEVVIRAKHVESGLVARGYQQQNGTYILSPLRPGLHEIHLGGTIFDQATSGSQHIEMFDVPDQDEVQKNFMMPEGPAE